MKLTKRLLSYLHRVFDKSPEPFLALRLNCDGTGLTWSINDAVLTTVPVGGTAAPLSVQLTQYTVAALANYLAAQPGYVVAYSDGTQMSLLGAAVLMDGAGDVAQSNGDHLYGYTSVLWSYMEANAVELKAAETQIGNMLLQMSTTTAEDMWLDELGGYYKVPRNQGELDAQYGPRIISQVLRPLANNVAIENALRVINAGLPVSVDDYDTIVNESYGQFDVSMTVSLDFLAVAAYSTLLVSIIDTIDKMRDAGTFLRRIAILTGVEADYYVASTVISGETDVIGAPLSYLLGASFVCDFALSQTLSPGFSVARSTPANRFNAAGILESVAPNLPRFDFDPITLACKGLLIEGATTNVITNNTMVGAVPGTPGTLPTRWSSNYPAGGLNISVVGTGIESGIDYIDIRIFGVATDTTARKIVYFSEPSSLGIGSSEGDRWNTSAYLKLASGSTAGISNISLGYTCLNGNAIISDSVLVNVLGQIGTGNLAAFRAVNSPSAVASTSRVAPFLSISPQLGAIDMVLRIGLPCMDNGFNFPSPTSPIKTSGSEVTRASESCSGLTGPWFNNNEGSITIKVDRLGPGRSGFQYVFCQIGDQTGESNSIKLNALTPVNVNFIVTTGGIQQCSIPIAQVTTPRTYSLAYRSDGFTAAANGSTFISGPGLIPTASRIALGCSTYSGSISLPLYGHIAYFAYYPKRLSDADLLTLSS